MLIRRNAGEVLRWGSAIVCWGSRLDGTRFDHRAFQAWWQPSRALRVAFQRRRDHSSFYRPHRRSTYERWAASVPDGFRFAVKLPKTITHERRLHDCRGLLERFADEVIGLGEKRGPILVQLPPSLGFERATGQRFLADARNILGGAIVCEPRHVSWFNKDADENLADEHVTRVVADPIVTPAGLQPGGWRHLTYFRLHGAPRIYWSNYSDAAIGRHAVLVRDLSTDGHVVWTIFDNTAAGCAAFNALALVQNLSQ